MNYFNKSKIYHTEKMVDSSYDLIDFDNEENTNLLTSNLIFQLEENMVNLGVWVHLEQPNFFEGSFKA